MGDRDGLLSRVWAQLCHNCSTGEKYSGMWVLFCAPWITQSAIRTNATAGEGISKGNLTVFMLQSRTKPPQCTAARKKTFQLFHYKEEWRSGQRQCGAWWISWQWPGCYTFLQQIIWFGWLSRVLEVFYKIIRLSTFLLSTNHVKIGKPKINLSDVHAKPDLTYSLVPESSLIAR